MKEVPLTQGLVAKVDDRDYDFVMAAGLWQAVFWDKQWWMMTGKDGRMGMRGLPEPTHYMRMPPPPKEGE